MPKKMHCPFHNDATASLAIYEDSYHCFGCSAHGPLSDLTDLSIKVVPKKKEKPENILPKISYIERLPKKKLRGLVFPCDSEYFYILWPGGTYYLKRHLHQSEGSKYIGPRGHDRPLYSARRGKFDRLIIVEGELNAMSLNQTFLPCDIVSPGSANSLARKKFLDIYRKYSTIDIVVDEDAAGVKGAIELRALLLDYTPYVEIHLMKDDANDVLQRSGIDGLEREMEALLGLSG